MTRFLLILMLMLAAPRVALAGLRFGGESLREKIIELNTVGGGGGEALPCPASTATGEVHYTDLTESFDCDGDEGFTFTESTNLVNINEATDGDSILLRLDNDQANVAGSTNETAQMRFGFGTDTDVARIVVGKNGNFSSGSQQDSYLSFSTDTDGTSQQGLLIESESGAPGVGIALSGTRVRNTLDVNGNAAIGSTAVNDNAPSNGLIIDGVTQIGDRTFASGAYELEVLGGIAEIALSGSSNSSTRIWHRRNGVGLSEWDTLKVDNQPTHHRFFALNSDAFPSWFEFSHEDVNSSSPINEEYITVVLGGEYTDLAAIDSPIESIESGATITNMRHIMVVPPVINGVAGGATETITNAATLYVSAAPSGSDITITNPYAIWVDDGAVRFDGTVTLASSVTNQGDITIQKADPSIIYDVVTATDTDFWAGVQDDAGSDDDDTYQIGKGTSPGTTPRFTMTGAGAISLVDKLTTYNNIATVSNGVPSEVATIDSTGLTANVAAATLYTVPSSGEGMYRVSAYVVLTTAGSVSSTLPNVQIVYTDKDSNTSVTLDATPVLGAAGLGQTGALTANTVGTVDAGVVPIYVKASTTIQYQTVNYASVAAGMAYALRIKLEAL